MAGRRPVFHAFSLLTAFALVATLLRAAAGVPFAAPAVPASSGAAGAAGESEGNGAHPGVAGASGGDQTGQPVNNVGQSGAGGEDQGDGALTEQPQRPQVPVRPPAPCIPKAPLAAAAAAGESLPYVIPGSAEAPAGGLADLEQKLTDDLAGRPGAYGVAVVDLATGATAAVGADQVFVAASTFKVPLVMYVLDLAAMGEADLEEQVLYAPEDWEGGTGILHSSVPGDCHTVSELVNLALTVSDNIATNMLLRRFGDENVFAYMRELGGTVTNLDTGRRATTPRDMVRYLERAYRLAATGEGLHYRTLMGLLTQTAFRDRIAAGSPPGIPVAHKIGTLPGMVHDVGIVFLPERPFAVAIFSAGVNEDAAAADLSQITRIVSEYLAPGIWDGAEEPAPPGDGTGDGAVPPAGGMGDGPAPSGDGTGDGAVPPATGTGDGPAPPGGGSGDGAVPPAIGTGDGPAPPGGGTGDGAVPPADGTGDGPAPPAGAPAVPPGTGDKPPAASEG